MPVLKIAEPARYHAVLVQLFKVGGWFQTWDPDTIIVGPNQYRALIRAGLVDSSDVKSREQEQKGGAR